MSRAYRPPGRGLSFWYAVNAVRYGLDARARREGSPYYLIWEEIAGRGQWTWIDESSGEAHEHGEALFDTDDVIARDWEVFYPYDVLKIYPEG